MYCWNTAIKILDRKTLGDFDTSIGVAKSLGIMEVHAIKMFLERLYSYDDEVEMALVSLSTDEFMRYLTTRYHIQWYPCTSYRVEI